MDIELGQNLYTMPPRVIEKIEEIPLWKRMRETAKRTGCFALRQARSSRMSRCIAR
jgi:hypothetical protein